MKISDSTIMKALETIGDYVRWAVSEFERVPVFYGHGTDNAWDEAIQLIFPLLHLPLDNDPAPFLNARLLPSEKKALIKLIRMRTVKRIPVAYLTHQAWFCGLKFYVNEEVLIPRSPIAELIEKRFAPWLPVTHTVSRILDIGTGSGCIACACAVAFPEAEVDAVDISPNVLKVAEKNVKKLGLANRVHLIESDLFSNILEQKYDIIVSNPPYVDAAEMKDLPPEYRHEPRLGLESGEDGLDCVRKILRRAKHYLTPDGLLIVEVGFSAQALSDAFPELPFTWIEMERGGEGVFVLSASDL